jgi:hypothetical protein
MSETEQPKFYRPEGPKVDPLPIPKSDAKSELSSIADDRGLIKVQLDQEAVLPRIANGIYANFESGFRETYANAITACLNAKEQFPDASPRIEITFNKDTRLLEIKEVDSTGISFEAFRDIYVVVGRSGNFDGTKPGQFGFGRMAWTTLSDRMILQTRYRTVDGKTGQFAVEGKNGLAFAILPEPSLDTFGTTISMVIYDKIAPDKLITYIKEASELSPVDTYLTLVDDLLSSRIKLNRTCEEVLTDRTHWIRPYYGRHTDEEYATHTWSNIYVFKEPEFEVYAVNITRKSWGMAMPDLVYDGTETVLLNLPINTSIKLPFSRALIRILDERALAPTADRERLKEETENLILDKLKRHLVSHFSKYVVHDTDQFIKLDLTDKVILHAVIHDWRIQDISMLVDNDTRLFMESLERARINVKGIDEHKRRYFCDLATLLTYFTKDEMFVDAIYTRKHLMLLRTVVPRAIILLEDSFLNNHNTQQLLDQLQLRNATEYIKTNKLKLPPRPKSASPRGYTVHKATTTLKSILPRDETKTYTTVNEIPAENLIVVSRKDSITKYAAILNQVATKYQLMLSNSVNKGTKFEDFIEKVGKSKQMTSRGEIYPKDFLAFESIMFALNDDPAVAAELYESDERLVVFADSEDRIFELAAYLTKHDKPYKIMLLPHEEFETYVGAPFHDFSQNSSYFYNHDKLSISKLMWSLMRLYKAAADKETAFLLMQGLAHLDMNQGYDDDAASKYRKELERYTLKALAIARQTAAK